MSKAYPLEHWCKEFPMYPREWIAEVVDHDCWEDELKYWCEEYDNIDAEECEMLMLAVELERLDDEVSH